MANGFVHATGTSAMAMIRPLRICTDSLKYMTEISSIVSYSHEKIKKKHVILVLYSHNEKHASMLTY